MGRKIVYASQSSKDNFEESLRRSKEESITNVRTEPSYRFEIGETVYSHNHECTVLDIANDYKIYLLTHTFTNKTGDVTTIERWYPWYEVRPINIPEHECIISPKSVELSYTTRVIEGLIIRFYHMGINMNPEYQRGYVWDLTDKQKFIDSVFQNVDLGKFVFYDTDDYTPGKFVYEIIDGKQRLSTLIEFYENRFPMSNGLYYNYLSGKERNHFKNRTIQVADISKLTRNQIYKLFITLNTSGKRIDDEHINKVKEMIADD